MTSLLPLARLPTLQATTKALVAAVVILLVLSQCPQGHAAFASLRDPLPQQAGAVKHAALPRKTYEPCVSFFFARLEV